MAYLLDSDVFIQAKNLHYGFDFCPAFWEWLEKENSTAKLFSIERVGDELLAGADVLADWAAKKDGAFFLKPSPKMLGSLAKVSSWAAGQNYEPAAVSTFLQLADYYLVAHALAEGFTVVTHEKPATSSKKIKIPDACIGLGVKCMTPFEMLRLEKARFILGS